MTLRPLCSPYVFAESIRVRDGATLTLEPGTVLTFAPAAALEVGVEGTGRLVATGSASAVIRLTASLPGDQQGTWGGVVLGVDTLEGTTLEHVEVASVGEEACLAIEVDRPGVVSVTRTTFRGCAGAAVTTDHPDFRFHAFSSNNFRECGVGLAVNANTVGSVGDALTYVNTPHNVVTQDDPVGTSATWLAQPVPWVMEGDLEVYAPVEGDPVPVLTLSAGTVLRFPEEAGVVVGDMAAGALVVAGTAESPVVLESNQEAAAAGGWLGVGVGGVASPETRIQHAVIRHAGVVSVLHRGGLTCSRALTTRLTVTHTVFELNDRADVSICQCPFFDESDNTYRGVGVRRGDCG
jgi:hypothetical protein